MERGELRRLLGVAPTGAREPVLVREAEPAKFLAALGAAVAGEGDVFLGHPAWTDGELALVGRLMAAKALRRADRGWLMVPTGGTSGRIRFARHDGHSLAAAVRGFSRHFDLPVVHALGVLPLHHVSGLMAWMRCAMTGGDYRAWDWKALEGGVWPDLPGGRPWVLSLVPTQLERLLREPAAVARLREFRAVFLGGAPAWPDLLERAAAARLPLSLGYGMTETAAMVTASRPEEYLAGDRTAGRALPHARVEIDGEGIIRIAGPSLFRGYFPDWRHERKFFDTADVGAFDGRRLVALGRRDEAIITGGEKVHPLGVEAVLKAATDCGCVAVVGLPDAEWGERVVAVYAAGANFDIERARAAARRELPAPQRPKDYVALRAWPTNEAGKLDRAALRKLAACRDAGTE